MNWQGILKTYYRHHSRFLKSVSNFSPSINVEKEIKDALVQIKLIDNDHSNQKAAIEQEVVDIKPEIKGNKEIKPVEEVNIDDVMMPSMPDWMDAGEIPDLPEFFAETEDDSFVPEKTGVKAPIKNDLKYESLEVALDMEDLRRIWGDCHRCGLSQTRKNLVFGEGNPSASILFVGEGPGADEDRQGRPFVGKSGELLTRMIEAMGLTRNDVFIANIVKCRPPGNRDPEPGEILSCIPVLRRQIELIKPDLIICLGRVSAQSLLSTKDSITRLRGTFHRYEGIDLLVTFHPAYLLRSPEKKRDAWADLKMAMDRIGLKNG